MSVPIERVAATDLLSMVNQQEGVMLSSVLVVDEDNSGSKELFEGFKRADYEDDEFPAGTVLDSSGDVFVVPNEVHLTATENITNIHSNTLLSKVLLFVICF